MHTAQGEDDPALEWLNQAIAANPGNRGFEETSLTMALVQYRKGQKRRHDNGSQV